MKFSKTIALSFFALIVTTNVYANTKGKMDFLDLSSHYGEPKVEIDLSGALIKMISGFANHSDPELSEIVKKLESINIAVYQLNDDFEKAYDSIDEMSKTLKKGNWDALVSVNNVEDNEKVRIFSQSTEDVIEGIVVMVVSPETKGGEAVFINIVGEVGIDQVAKVASLLDVDLN